MPKSRKRKRSAPTAKPQSKANHIRLPSGNEYKINVNEKLPYSPDKLAEELSKGIHDGPESIRFLSWLDTLPPEVAEYQLDQIKTNLTVFKNIHDLTNAELHSAKGLPPITHKFIDMVKTGEMDICRHIRKLAPAPATWVAWAPSRIRCIDCTQIEFKRIHGTSEDRRCDNCNTIYPALNNLSIIVNPGLIRGVSVTVMLVFGICKRCTQASEYQDSN